MSSPAQDDNRLIFKAAALRWNAVLTDAQREAWRIFTERFPRTDQLGQKYAPSGQNRHAGCNAIANLVGYMWLDDPPLDLHCNQPQTLQIVTATAAPQALLVSVGDLMDADEIWLLCGTPQTNVGKHNVENLWRPFLTCADPLPTTYDAILEYTAKFAPLVAGKKVNIKFQILNGRTGTISQGLTACKLVT